MSLTKYRVQLDGLDADVAVVAGERVDAGHGGGGVVEGRPVREVGERAGRSAQILVDQDSTRLHLSVPRWS